MLSKVRPKAQNLTQFLWHSFVIQVKIEFHAELGIFWQFVFQFCLSFGVHFVALILFDGEKNQLFGWKKLANSSLYFLRDTYKGLSLAHPSAIFFSQLFES